MNRSRRQQYPIEAIRTHANELNLSAVPRGHCRCHLLTLSGLGRNHAPPPAGLRGAVVPHGAHGACESPWAAVNAVPVAAPRVPPTSQAASRLVWCPASHAAQRRGRRSRQLARLSALRRAPRGSRPSWHRFSPQVGARGCYVVSGWRRWQRQWPRPVAQQRRVGSRPPRSGTRDAPATPEPPAAAPEAAVRARHAAAAARANPDPPRPRRPRTRAHSSRFEAVAAPRGSRAPPTRQ